VRTILTKRFIEAFAGTGPSTLIHTCTPGTFVGIVIRNDVMVLAAGFVPASSAEPVRVSTGTPAFTGDHDESMGSSDNIITEASRIRMGCC